MKKYLSILIASFSFITMTLSQNAVLTSKVIDSKGLILPGATISVSGENKGTVSNNNGSFTMIKLIQITLQEPYMSQLFLLH